MWLRVLPVLALTSALTGFAAAEAPASDRPDHSVRPLVGTLQQPLSCPSATFCQGVESGPGTAAIARGDQDFGPRHATGLDEPRAISCSSSRFCVALNEYDSYATWNPADHWTVHAARPVA